ncbi:MAG TPA: MerR family transcriptional regulator [Chloroflexi bacterium]|jgi:DNA-binding transcriptional MerR regulator|nr:MerR family transcriptional regulator [Chloroflexota bacterium]
MAAYTVHQVAEMAGVSVRTLHHYDHIGLLKPAARTAAGYRLYGQDELLRLQQILLFRELDVPLATVRNILDDPGFDPVAALEAHRRTLEGQVARLRRLLQTIDRTIQRIKEDTMALTDDELYEGLPKEKAERWRREARELYGASAVEESEQRVRKLSKAEWNTLKDEGDAVTRGMAALMGREPGDPEVQALVARHYAWLEHFWHADAEAYRGLARLYVENDEFRATYDSYRPGLAEFMEAAMHYYADHTLSAEE